MRTRKLNRAREPQQRRAKLTVDSILEAVVRILKREGIEGVNTNRIAEVAGVSIGSIYQYFPDKRAIFAALHRRHVEEIDRLVESTLVRYAACPLEELMRALIRALVEAHTAEPELFHMISTEVPDRAGGTLDFASRLHGALHLAVAARLGDHDVAKKAYVVTHILDALSHGAALRRPKGLSIAEAIDEAVRAVMAYLNC